VILRYCWPIIREGPPCIGCSGIWEKCWGIIGNACFMSISWRSIWEVSVMKALGN